MVHISAIGADPEGPKPSMRAAKVKGEADILAAIPGATILRPSVVFGLKTSSLTFCSLGASFALWCRYLGRTQSFSQFNVDDIAEAVEAVLIGKAASGTYELGGPEVASFAELMHMMLDVIRRSRLVLRLPFWVGGVMARVTVRCLFLTGGLAPQPVTSDQPVGIAPR